jgi:hypothetical protein
VTFQRDHAKGRTAVARASLALAVLLALGCTRAHVVDAPASSLEGCRARQASVVPASEFFAADVLVQPGSFVDSEAAALLLRDWWGKHLSAMREPPLACASTYDVEVFRFTYIPTFDHPWAIRLERANDGAVVFVTENCGAGGYEPAENCRRYHRFLSEPEWRSVSTALAKARFWDLPVHPPHRDIRRLCTDGERAVFEWVRGGRYHVVARHSCELGEVAELGDALFELSRVDLRLAP